VHKLINIAEAALSPIDTILRWMVSAALLTMTGVLIVNVIGRTAFNYSFTGAPTAGRLLMIWLTFIGSYLVIRYANHITVDMLLNYLPRRVNRVLGVITNSVSAVLSAYVAWLGYLYTASRFTMGQMDVMLHIPTGFFYFPVPMGFSLMTVGFLIKAIKIMVDESATPSAAIPTETGRDM